MQNLTSEQKDALLVHLKANRQWTREHNIAYARLMLKFAHAKEDKPGITFWRSVVAAYAI